MEKSMGVLGTISGNRKLALVLMGSLFALGISSAQSAFAVPIELVENGGFESGALGPWGTSGLDNVSLQAVPEPSTTLLLTLGLVGFSARRHRRVSRMSSTTSPLYMDPPLFCD